MKQKDFRHQSSVLVQNVFFQRQTNTHQQFDTFVTKRVNRKNKRKEWERFQQKYQQTQQVKLIDSRNQLQYLNRLNQQVNDSNGFSRKERNMINNDICHYDGKKNRVIQPLKSKFDIETVRVNYGLLDDDQEQMKTVDDGIIKEKKQQQVDNKQYEQQSMNFIMDSSNKNGQRIIRVYIEDNDDESINQVENNTVEITNGCDNYSKVLGDNEMQQLDKKMQQLDNNAGGVVKDVQEKEVNRLLDELSKQQYQINQQNNNWPCQQQQFKGQKQPNQFNSKKSKQQKLKCTKKFCIDNFGDDDENQSDDNNSNMDNSNLDSDFGGNGKWTVNKQNITQSNIKSLNNNNRNEIEQKTKRIRFRIDSQFMNKQLASDKQQQQSQQQQEQRQQQNLKKDLQISVVSSQVTKQQIHKKKKNKVLLVDFEQDSSDDKQSQNNSYDDQQDDRLKQQQLKLENNSVQKRTAVFTRNNQLDSQHDDRSNITTTALRTTNITATATTEKKNKPNIFLSRFQDSDSDQDYHHNKIQNISNPSLQKINLYPDNNKLTLSHLSSSSQQQSQQQQYQQQQITKPICISQLINILSTNDISLAYQMIPQYCVLQTIVKRYSLEQMETNYNIAYQLFDGVTYKSLIKIKKVSQGFQMLWSLQSSKSTKSHNINNSKHLNLTTTSKNNHNKNKQDISCALVTSNFFGTQFNCYKFNRNNQKPQQKKLNRLITINYQTNFLGLKGPRKMELYIPSVDSIVRGDKSLHQLYQQQQQKISKQSLQQRINKRVIKFVNRKPKWNSQISSFVLNFHGRATVSSVKNFIITFSNQQIQKLKNTKNIEKDLVVFGKIDKNIFNLDIKYPFSIVQGFALALSSFDKKLGCE